MNDTRRQARELVGGFRFSTYRTALISTGCIGIASIVAFVPSYAGLLDDGRMALFILILGAGLWISEAIPAFATSLLVIGLEIILLGRSNGGFSEAPNDYEKFLAPWGSPLIWLFFGGFVMASAAEKTGLDRWMALGTLGRFGRKPALLLMGTMAVTAVLSMFISNTATATLMLTALLPLVTSRPKGDPLAQALLIGVAFASNIGGMGTIIGSPPNAIAVGALANVRPVNFAEWMVLAVPTVIVLLVIAWLWIGLTYLRGQAWKNLDSLYLDVPSSVAPPEWQQSVVVATFVATIGLWLTGPMHHLPTTVVSFLPICMFTATGILAAEDMRRLPWDVLLLIVGGLSLGVAINETGLATWIVAQLPFEGITPIFIVLAFGLVTVFLSNLMSNTAATNIVVPIVIAVIVAQQADARLLVPVALAASCAMCLPISTPPNAIVFSSGRLSTTDLLWGGLLIGVLGPLLATGWAILALRWLP